MIDYSDLCKQVCLLAKTAGAFIRQEKNKITFDQVETKSLHSYVTYVDKQAEQMIVDGLKALLPGAGFITEEETETTVSADFNWIIDPLDGTTNFIHRLEPFAVSIALREKEETVIGVVYEIGKDECFYSYKDSPTFLNDTLIRVSETKNLSASLIATGFPYYDYTQNKNLVACLENFMRRSAGIRRFGSAATDLAYVACGRFDAFYEYSLNAWDVAAGAFIVERAGGKVCDFKKGNNYLFGREMVASNAGIFNEFSDVINQFLG
jgi:myo-inositol-1(or 4)-monophosphatase